jgi:hypothetical protein
MWAVPLWGCASVGVGELTVGVVMKVTSLPFHFLFTTGLAHTDI